MTDFQIFIYCIMAGFVAGGTVALAKYAVTSLQR